MSNETYFVEDATADYEDCCSIPGQDLDVFKRILERRSKFSDKTVSSAQSSSNQVSTDEKMLVIEGERWASAQQQCQSTINTCWLVERKHCKTR